jgi:hypothetical protein
LFANDVAVVVVVVEVVIDEVIGEIAGDEVLRRGQRRTAVLASELLNQSAWLGFVCTLSICYHLKLTSRLTPFFIL